MSRSGEPTSSSAVDGNTVLLVARHGETEWNRTDRWQGFKGPALNERGRQQAERLAVTVGAVREVNFGEWEGLTHGEITERYPDALDRWDGGQGDAPPGGEADTAMATRVLEAVHEISARHKGQRVLVVTSGGPIRALQAHAAGAEQATARRHFTRVDNCAVVEMHSRNGVIAAMRPGAHASRRELPTLRRRRWRLD